MRSQLRPILQPILGERRHIQDRDLNLEMAATEAMRARLAATVDKLQDVGIPVSLFIDADRSQIEVSAK